MSCNCLRIVLVGVCSVLLAAELGCGGATSAPISGATALGAVSVTITPAAMNISTSTTQTFTALVNNSGLQTVEWQVDGIPGGAPLIGTIDKSGNYTAPQFIPQPPTVTISAVPQADTTKIGSASATIVGSVQPALVYMSPAGTGYVQAGTRLKLSGGVVGPLDGAVIWQVNGVTNGNSTVGTITPGANNTAVYTAPAKVPSPATVAIQVLSHAQPNRSAQCLIVLSAQPPTIATVTVTPVVSVVQAQTNFTYIADVINVSDPSVSWEVDGPDGNPNFGGSTVNGTIGSTGPDTGIYTGPAEVPPLGSTVVVSAVSNAQPTRFGSGVVNISPPPPLGVTVQVAGPGTILTGGQGFYNATVGNSNVQTVTWQVNGITGGNATVGTISPDLSIPDQGDYQAPTNAPKPPVVVIGAIPTANPKIEATLPVTIAPPNVNVSVACFPITCLNGTEQLGVGETQQFQMSVTGVGDQTGTWFVCIKTTDPSNCVFGGNATLGTISPSQGTNLVTYTAPASVPSPPLVIIKAIPNADPVRFATATVTVSTVPVSVQVSPPGPLNVQVTQLGGPFTANVIGSTDQNVSWFVNGILNGNSTVGTMIPDSQNLGAEDYIAPANIPSPATVLITAVPEADSSVVSNTVKVTVIPLQNNIMISISPDPPPPLLPGQSNPNFSADVKNSSDQVAHWTLSPKGGGICTDPLLPTPCGTINPPTTNNTPTTYTAPDVAGLPDPYFVNITATADADNTKQATVTQEITAEAGASIAISPSSLTIQAGTLGSVPFQAIGFNIQDFDQQNVSWTMSCNSLAPAGENCGKKPFGQFQDKGGPGCFNPEDGGMNVCNDESFIDPGGVQPEYTAPGVLGNSYQAVDQCNTSPSDTNGFVAVTVEVTGIENCPGPLGICQATMCIQITPPTKEKP